MGLGERCKLPSGVWGEATARNRDPLSSPVVSFENFVTNNSYVFVCQISLKFLGGVQTPKTPHSYGLEWMKEKNTQRSTFLVLSLLLGLEWNNGSYSRHSKMYIVLLTKHHIALIYAISKVSASEMSEQTLKSTLKLAFSTAHVPCSPIY